MYRKFTTFVISAHLLVILFLLFAPAKKAPKPHKHIAVRTIQTKPQPMTIVSNSPQKNTKAIAKAQPPKKTTPAPAPKPAPKKTAVVEKNKPAPPKKQPSKEVWKEIDEKVYPSPKPSLSVPQMQASSPFEAPSIGFDHEESLAGFLHSSLNLPEFGEVTIELTVKRDGSVARLVVVKAESKKNRAYLEQHLPALRFPMILENEKTFTLTFCNEI